MKALIISLFIITLLSKGLEGQNKTAKDSVIINKHFRQFVPQLSPSDKSKDFFQQTDTIISEKFFRQQIPGFMPGGEYRAFTEMLPDTNINQFPGSSRYYAKRPELISSDRHFIMNPDTSSKCFLIIKNPLTNEIIR
jgi:hypothetical protein